MTKEQKIEYIRNACIKANPSIKDLMFGCVVEQKYTASKTTTVIDGIHETIDKEQYVYTTHGRTAERIYLERYKPSDNYILRIIGRPIRLVDVLLAMEANKKWPPYRIGTHGLFFVAKEVSPTPMYISTGVMWDMSKDDLTLQSDETISFIHSLLSEPN